MIFFEKETTLYENWVQGQRNVVNSMDQKDIRGEYILSAGGTYNMNISGKASKPKIEIKQDTLKLESKINYKGDWVTISFSKEKGSKLYRMSGLITKESNDFSGQLVLPNGQESTFNASRTASFEEKKNDKNQKGKTELVAMTYPNTGYGYKSKPKQENILFKNATVWTGNAILENTDVLVKGGKIAKVGNDLSAGGAKIVDATGKHLTARGHR